MRLTKSAAAAILLLSILPSGPVLSLGASQVRSELPQSSLSGLDDRQFSDSRPHPSPATVAESRQFVRSQPAFSAGLGDLQDKRYEQAILQFLSALKLDPSFVTARYDLGVAYFAINRFEDARQTFRKVLQQSPGHRFAQYFLARIDLIQGNEDAAIRGFKKVSDGKPLADELYYLGEAYFRKGDNQEAIRTLQRASAWKPYDYRVRLLLGRVYQKMGLLPEAREQIALSENLRASYRRGSQEILECSSALNSSSPDRAVKLCRQLLDGTDPANLVSLGVLFAERHLYQEALGPLEKAAHMDPEDYEAQFNLGLTYFNMKNYQQARRPLEAAAALRPESYDAAALLGSLLFSLGDDYNAARELRQAHALRPDDAKITALLFSELGIISQHLLAVGKYKESIVYAQEALALNPRASELHLQLAQAYAALGDTVMAKKEQQASRKVPQMPAAQASHEKNQSK